MVPNQLIALITLYQNFEVFNLKQLYRAEAHAKCQNVGFISQLTKIVRNKLK